MKRRVFIECTGYGQTGARYRVTDEGGRVLVASSRVPEFDAARVLSAEGVTGELEVWRPTGIFPAMRIDIAKAAGLTVLETPVIGPRFVAWEINSLYKSENGDDDRATTVELSRVGVSRWTAGSNFQVARVVSHERASTARRQQFAGLSIDVSLGRLATAT